MKFSSVNLPMALGVCSKATNNDNSYSKKSAILVHLFFFPSFQYRNTGKGIKNEEGAKLNFQLSNYVF